MNLLDEMAELESAEEFMEYFELPFETAVVHVNRLHILQKFHNLMQEEPAPGDSEDTLYAHYRTLLARAYESFVTSDAQTEKLFRVFKQGGPQVVHITPDQIGRSGASS